MAGDTHSGMLLAPLTRTLKMGQEVIRKTEEEKDLGVVIQDTEHRMAHKQTILIHIQDINQYQDGFPLC